MQSHRHRLNDLASYGGLGILFARSKTRVIVGQMQHGMLSRGESRNRATLTSNPNRLLGCDFSGVIECPLFSQTCSKGSKPLRAKIGHEFFAFELGSKKIIPAIWNFFLGD